MVNGALLTACHGVQPEMGLHSRERMFTATSPSDAVVCPGPHLVCAAATVRPAPWQLAVAAAIWLVSVGGESLADAQLARFRADPANRGKTCRSGLWRYSRHPNYFFEWLHWCAYAVAAIGAPLAWLGWLGPVVMYLFLRYISGIPFTEQQALRTRGDDYRDYQRSTPMLFPWFPKS